MPASLPPPPGPIDEVLHGVRFVLGAFRSDGVPRVHERAAYERVASETRHFLDDYDLLAVLGKRNRSAQPGAAAADHDELGFNGLVFGILLALDLFVVILRVGPCVFESVFDGVLYGRRGHGRSRHVVDLEALVRDHLLRHEPKRQIRQAGRLVVAMRPHVDDAPLVERNFHTQVAAHPLGGPHVRSADRVFRRCFLGCVSRSVRRACAERSACQRGETGERCAFQKRFTGEGVFFFFHVRPFLSLI